MKDTPKFGSWEEWGRHVIQELQRMNTNIENLSNSHEALKQETKLEIVKLKIKSGLFGALAGAIPVAIAIAVERYMSK